jgi:predicted metal-binding membrane protein
MESAMLRRILARPRPIDLALVASVVVLAGGAWVLTGERMAGMDAGPGTDLGGLGWFAGAWVTMMAAMMLPSLAPMVFGHARIGEGRRGRGRTAVTGATAAFVAGYLLAWVTAGLLGYMIVEGVRELDPGFLAWEEQGPYVAGAVILGAALYQLSSLKDSCLRQCRSPAMLLQHWRPGRVGALRMGFEHGGFCIGCCWALMAALVAVGVMNVAWMAVIAALIAAEKLLPWRAIANRGIAALLVVLAIAIAFAPADVPALTIPGSPEAMEGMGMEAERGKSMEGSESMGEGRMGDGEMGGGHTPGERK